MQLQPVLWLNLLVGLPVLGYTVFLFYTGVPIMMEIPQERGFLFASAVMAFGLVALVALLVISVLLWGSALAPASRTDRFEAHRGAGIGMQGTYNYTVVRQFAVMTIVWGIVGMLVGVVIAAQLAWPALNFDIPWLTYGRLRPLHTNAVIFAFGGSALFATSYYVVQRTCHVRLFCRRLAAFTFWGWQV